MNVDTQIKERYDLTIERIRKIVTEDTVAVPYRAYFKSVAKFILEVHQILKRVTTVPACECELRDLKKENENIYEDVLGANYDTSYANPEYAVEQFGKEVGQILSFLYAEIRGEIPYAYEKNPTYLAICNELFIEIYNCFERNEELNCKELRNIIYWYASDYCDVFLADQMEAQLNPKVSFVADIITSSDLSDLRYLYKFGEYISENEYKTAEHMNSLSQEMINKMAEVYTEGYRIGFVNAGIDLSKKAVVNVEYVLGFERVVKKAIKNFAKMGLTPTFFRAPVSVITRKTRKRGYFGGAVNKQYEYDHRFDQGLFLDKKFMERKLDVMKNTYEQFKELAGKYAGPAVIETFGEEPFAPKQKEAAITLTDKQEKLTVLYNNKAGQLTNQYIKGDERSFTIVAYPIPEVGKNYADIFNEVIRINTLDAKLYEKVQQTLIDALDQGEYVHILGTGENKTDLKVQLYHLSNPEKETIFENCVADVNIPVGEVFTSPVLEGTEGILHVSRVYLNELQYKDLKIIFQDGKIADYGCSNFADAEEGKKYIKSNILHNHETLPLGEFAIGTNTTAYVVAKKYQIEDKMPILIAEKMGPHFAVGDTCYSWSEDNKLYNPNGKEIVAKDNSISMLRKEDVSKAYFQCHTDITIPYEEIKSIMVITKEGVQIPLLKEGRFVLPGTEILNKPFVAT